MLVDRCLDFAHRSCDDGGYFVCGPNISQAQASFTELVTASVTEHEPTLRLDSSSALADALYVNEQI